MPLSEEEKDELVAYLDNELDEQAVQAVEARIATDPEARAELDALKQTWGMLDYLPRASPSPNFTNRTLEKLSLEKISGVKTAKAPARRRWPWLTAASWAAALVLAIGAGYWGSLHFFPASAPPDADEQPLVRYLPLLEKWRYYENVDDREFLNGLAQPDLFGDEPS